ncbi:unnamed protein product [Caenorhabditis angaria]|uniref:Serpentine receptor class gamma n=1 Tax=Caenorhabditis angaria TaxID=860376 RepID=A0A9P1N7Z3_9PELO|nr:unnamed protein product [Caenorhabditis angaria]
MLTTVAMSLNRYTCCNFPLVHKKFWTRHMNKIIAFIIIIPLLCCTPIAIAKVFIFVYNGHGQMYYIHYFSWFRTTYPKIIIGIPSVIFIIYANISAVRNLEKLNRDMIRVEFAMTLATIFVSIGFFAMLIFSASYTIASEKYLDQSPMLVSAILALQQICNDYYMLSGPVVLIILDKRIRQAVLCCRRSRKFSVRQKTTTITMSGIIPHN